MDQKKNNSLIRKSEKSLATLKKESENSKGLAVMPHEVGRFYGCILSEMMHSETDGEERVGLDEAVKSLENLVVVTEESDENLEEIRERWRRDEEVALRYSPSYKRALEIKQELHWMDLAGVTVFDAIGVWLSKIINHRTKRTYEMAMQELCKKGLINPHMTLQAFSMRNHDVTVDEIKVGKFFYEKKSKCPTSKKMISEILPWSEATRQQRAAAFIAFTAHLERTHGGIIRKAKPDRLSKDKTFYRVRNEVKTAAFQNRKELKRFLDHLHKINPRDCLIAKMQVQGGRRISEVLSVETNQIDFEKREITFRQSKTKGTEKTLIATYSQEFIEELKMHIGDRKGLVFVSSKGTPLFAQHIERNFKKAGERAGINFKVQTHTMRASAVTHYKINGCSDSDIQKLTGQSAEMIRMYDKTDKAQNASKIVNLI